MADATDVALVVVVKHGVKKLLNMIGTFSVNQSLAELYESLNFDAGDRVLVRVQVAPSETGTWRDVDKGIGVRTLTTFNTRHVWFRCLFLLSECLTYK